jgi:hypothetical protein
MATRRSLSLTAGAPSDSLQPKFENHALSPSEAQRLTVREIHYRLTRAIWPAFHAGLGLARDRLERAYARRGGLFGIFPVVVHGSRQLQHGGALARQEPRDHHDLAAGEF